MWCFRNHPDWTSIIGKEFRNGCTDAKKIYGWMQYKPSFRKDEEKLLRKMQREMVDMDAFVRRNNMAFLALPDATKDAIGRALYVHLKGGDPTGLEVASASPIIKALR